MPDVPPEVQALADALRNIQEPHDFYSEDWLLLEGARRIMIELSRSGYKIVPLGTANA